MFSFFIKPVSSVHVSVPVTYYQPNGLALVPYKGITIFFFTRQTFYFKRGKPEIYFGINNFSGLKIKQADYWPLFLCIGAIHLAGTSWHQNQHLGSLYGFPSCPWEHGILCSSWALFTWKGLQYYWEHPNSIAQVKLRVWGVLHTPCPPVQAFRAVYHSQHLLSVCSLSLMALTPSALNVTASWQQPHFLTRLQAPGKRTTSLPSLWFR